LRIRNSRVCRKSHSAVKYYFYSVTKCVVVCSLCSIPVPDSCKLQSQHLMILLTASEKINTRDIAVARAWNPQHRGQIIFERFNKNSVYKNRKFQ